MVQVQEMAENRKVIQNILRGNGVEQTIEHLIKIIIFDSPRNVNHWKTEVYSNFHSLPLMRHNKRPPERKFIFNTIWDWYGDRLSYLVGSVIRQENNEKLKDKPNDVLAKEVNTKVFDYIQWLSKELSEKTKVSNQDVYNKLEQLGL